MKNSREFKKECVRKDFNGLSEMLLGKNSAEQILGEDGIKLSNVAKAKVLAKRSQIIAEVLQQKTITIPSQDSAEIILNDVVTLFYAEAFSKGAKDYSNEELLHYCIKTKAWNDAIQYARKIGGSAIDHETEIIEFLVDEISDENKFANVESNFDEWHRSILENAEKSGVKQDWGMNPGLWQKLINMSFKYLYCVKDRFPKLDNIWSKCHCPIDSIILTRLYNVLNENCLYEKNSAEFSCIRAYANREDYKSWNALTIEDYDIIQCVIKRVCAENYITPLQFDFIYW